MFKLITASAMLFVFIIQTFSGHFMQLNYYLNTAVFTKNCENKAKPMLHCNGKCQLMKKMQQEEKKDQQLPERKSANKSLVLSSQSYFASFEIQIPVMQNTYFKSTSSDPVDRALAVFHPPQV